MQDHQPGEVIVPLGSDHAAPSVAAPAVEPVATLPAPEQPSPVAQASPAPQTQLAPQTIQDSAPQPQVSSPSPAPTTSAPEAWYRPEPATAASPDREMSSDALSWEAEEFAHTAKDSRWYGMAVAAAVVVAVVVYLINRDIITAVIVLFAIVGLAFFSGRQPRVQRYSLSAEGIQAGNKWYNFADFQGFSISVDTPTTRSIVLLPLKRFMPLVLINLPPQYEQAASDILESVLPLQHRQSDAVDNFMQRLRF